MENQTTMVFFMWNLTFDGVSNVEKVASPDIKWVSSTFSELISSGYVPGGKEGNRYTFLCRTWHDGNLIAGKLLYWGNQCVIDNYGQEIKNENFEVLSAPPGVLSWYDFNGYLPQNAIISGRLKNGWTLYACRSFCRGDLVLGTFSRQQKRCFMPYYGECVSDTPFEVLVMNLYGLSLGHWRSQPIEDEEEEEEEGASNPK